MDRQFSLPMLVSMMLASFGLGVVGFAVLLATDIGKGDVLRIALFALLVVILTLIVVIPLNAFGRKVE